MEKKSNEKRKMKIGRKERKEKKRDKQTKKQTKRRRRQRRQRRQKKTINLLQLKHFVFLTIEHFQFGKKNPFVHHLVDLVKMK